MPKIEYNVFKVDPVGLARFKELPNESLENIIEPVEVAGSFISNEDFVELSYFTLDNVRVQTVADYRNYSVVSGERTSGAAGNAEISVDPLEDYKIFYGTTGEVKALYNFLRDPFLTNRVRQQFFFESISSDRKEARLLPVALDSLTVQQVGQRLNTRFFEEVYSVNLHLYPSENNFHSIVNVDIKPFRGTTSLILKFAEPLPQSYEVNNLTFIVEKIADSIAYEIETEVIPDEEIVPTLRGANFNVDVEEQNTEPSQYYNYNELFSFPVNNTNRELNSLFNEKGAELSIDYSSFSNFINFSSAEERLRNFRYKLDLINSYQSSLDNINDSTYTSAGISGSRNFYENLLNGVINNFDHFERHLYFESGSTSWPKLFSTPNGADKPYTNMASDEEAAISFYNTEIQSAVLYDSQNPDILTNTIPAFLKEDSNNEPYELFIHMIAQHFDNLWLYTDAVSKKYDADNRLDRGVSKDLVEDLLKNFGVKLYTSTKSAEDLFRYFTANSYVTDGEFLPSGITNSGEEPLSQNDYQKEIYKRIYHNLPILLKSKGTERGLRALINCFGIPSDVLKIKIFGGQSVNDLPYFGGEQALTGSFDKVRLDNTGSIVPGDTISFYTSINKKDNKYTQDLHRVEVGFSPSDNMDNYIVSQSAVLFPNDPFNIDQYIGDPRSYPTNKYTELYYHAQTVLADVSEYNVKDFVRLIKFFDNVLFRMVRDFIPARAVTDAGIIIKPHLLERNKAKEPVMTWTRPEYTGSIKVITMSGSNAGAYQNIGFGSVATSTDSAVFNKESKTAYSREVMTPLGIRPKVINSLSEILVEKNFNEAKFDGELKNSYFRITNGELNDENPFKQITYPEIQYNTQFWTEIPPELCILSTENTEYIITNPAQDLNLAAGVFIGDTPLYNFFVDGDTPNVNSFTHNFSEGSQYDVFNIVAEHINHPNIFNSASQEEGCRESRDVRIVSCFLGSVPTGNIPPIVTSNLPYNLYEIFFNPDDPNDPGTRNSEITYFVNGVEVGTTVNGIDDEENPNYNPSNPATAYSIPADYVGTTVDFEARDKYSSVCRILLQLNYDSCPLFDPSFLIPGREWITGLIPQIETATATQPAVFIAPFTFSGVTTTTTFKFRLRVVHAYRLANGTEISNSYQTEFVDINIDNWNGVTGLSNVPNNYFDIIASDEFNLSWLFPDPPPAVTGNFPYTEDKYTRFIQFKAITSVTCDALSRWYLFDSAEKSKREVVMKFFGSPNGSAINDYALGNICTIANDKTVYVNLPISQPTPDPITIILQPSDFPIFENGLDGDSTPAEFGVYGAVNSSDGENRGRRWNVESTAGGVQFGAWDQETEFDPNFGGNEGYDFTVVNGKIICSEPGGDSVTEVGGNDNDVDNPGESGVSGHDSQNPNISSGNYG
jgi:hypothetical protein|tara:strand:- start:2506 stop:6708 length:4203 start_codon:yes stop_codon:yes gene_type:complete